MSNKRVYKKHQAFNTAREEIAKASGTLDSGFERAKKFHHSPSKLDIFNHYISYFVWCTNLYSSSRDLIILLREIYTQVEGVQPRWFSRNKKIREALQKYARLKSDLQDLYDDVSEFQVCMLATDISEKQAQIDALSDQVSQLSTLETKIIETCSRKLYEVNSSRITYANLFVAIVALIVSLGIKPNLILESICNYLYEIKVFFGG